MINELHNGSVVIKLSMNLAMKSIKIFISNAQIKKNSEKIERVPLVHTDTFLNNNKGNNLANSETIVTTRIPYRQLK